MRILRHVDLCAGVAEQLWKRRSFASHYLSCSCGCVLMLCSGGLHLHVQCLRTSLTKKALSEAEKAEKGSKRKEKEDKDKETKPKKKAKK